MDKLITELLTLFREMLMLHEHLLSIALARQEAMRAFDMSSLNRLTEQETKEVAAGEVLEGKRKGLIERFRQELGRGIEPNTSEISRRAAEPFKSQLLGLAGKLKDVMERLDRARRINQKVSQSVAGSLAKVLKIVTGLAQHAGLYTAAGRKSAPRGVHLLDIAG